MMRHDTDLIRRYWSRCRGEAARYLSKGQPYRVPVMKPIALTMAPPSDAELVMPPDIDILEFSIQHTRYGKAVVCEGITVELVPPR